MSVTQQFNTSNSMGRLTLNMLLSFAQFEREVTTERIRDKVDASKKKGIWMGGPTPLGYKSIQKKLVIEPSEATTVRTIFEDYLSSGSVYELKHMINAKKLRPRGNKNKPFTQSSLNYILKNHIYVGRISHNGKSYQGEHRAIVDERLWSKVQQKLKQQAGHKHKTKRSGHISLLTGLLVDEAGNKLTPSHSCKGGKRYHSYITKEVYERLKVRRISATRIEATVLKTLIQLLQTQQSKKLTKLQALILSEKLQSGTREEKQEVIRKLADKVIVRDCYISIELKNSRGFQKNILNISLNDNEPSSHSIEREVGTNFNQRLFNLISEAHKYLNDLTSGGYNSVQEIAKHYKKDKSDISREIRLAFLAPDIITSICQGTQQTSLKATYLRKLKTIPHDWREQRQLLSYTYSTNNLSSSAHPSP